MIEQGLGELIFSRQHSDNTGTNISLELADDANGKIDYRYTISFFAKSKTAANAFLTIDFISDDERAMRLYCSDRKAERENNGRTTSILRVSEHANSVIQSKVNIFADDEWHHFVLAFGNVEGITYIGNEAPSQQVNFTLYVDGGLRLEESVTIRLRSILSNCDVQFGKDFDGKIALMKIYEGLFSIDEIKSKTKNDNPAIDTPSIFHFHEKIIMGESSSSKPINVNEGETFLIADPKFGSALYLTENKNHYFDFGVPVTQLGKKSFTLSMWLKTEENKTSILTKNILDTVWQEHDKCLFLDDKGIVSFEGWGCGYIKGKTPVTDNKWNHVAVVWDVNRAADKGEGKVYVNGVVDTGSCNFKPIYDDGSDGAVSIKLANKVNNTLVENKFKGLMAHVRIYDNGLSQGEVQRSITQDTLSLSAYQESHPVEFSVFDSRDHDTVLYITDNPEETHALTMELKNSSDKDIIFKSIDSEHALDDGFHLELMFRADTLSKKTIERLRKSPEKILEPKTGWNLFVQQQPRPDGTVSLYLSYTGAVPLKLEKGEFISFNFKHISAAPSSGARGTRVELRMKNLAYRADKINNEPLKSISIVLQQYLHVTNHQGDKYIPFHTSFKKTGSILNDGTTKAITLQLVNVANKSSQHHRNTTIILKANESKLSITADFGDVNDVSALCTEGQWRKVRAEVNCFNKLGKPIGTWESNTPVENEKFVLYIAPPNDLSIEPGGRIEIKLTGITTQHPAGIANVYVHYEKVPGYWDGNFLYQVEKSPMTFENNYVNIKGAGSKLKVEGDVKIGGSLLLSNNRKVTSIEAVEGESNKDNLSLPTTAFVLNKLRYEIDRLEEKIRKMEKLIQSTSNREFSLETLMRHEMDIRHIDKFYFYFTGNGVRFDDVYCYKHPGNGVSFSGSIRIMDLKQFLESIKKDKKFFVSIFDNRFVKNISKAHYYDSGELSMTNDLSMIENIVSNRLRPESEVTIFDWPLSVSNGLKWKWDEEGYIKPDNEWMKAAQKYFDEIKASYGEVEAAKATNGSYLLISLSSRTAKVK